MRRRFAHGAPPPRRGAYRDIVPAPSSDPLRDLLLRERRSALGGMRLAAGRAASDGETALLIGAANLLDKALRRLGSGDEAAAGRLVDRALALDPGPVGAIEPGPMAAHLLVAQELAAFRARRGDGWLDAATDLLRETAGAVATELGRALIGLLDDGDLSRAEAARIRAAVRSGAAFGDPLLEVPTGPERSAVVLALLRVVLHLREVS